MFAGQTVEQNYRCFHSNWSVSGKCFANIKWINRNQQIVSTKFLRNNTHSSDFFASFLCLATVGQALSFKLRPIVTVSGIPGL
jgi:hypothetical protein